MKATDVRKTRKLTQTVIDMDPHTTSGEKGEAAKANASAVSALEDGATPAPISLSVLRAELQKQFGEYRESAKCDIKAEIQSHCQEIREDIAALRAQTKLDIENTRGELMERVDRLCTMQKESADAQKDMERALNDHSDRIVALETLCQTLTKDHKQLQDKYTDMENRGRRRNIRIVGLAERIESNNAVSFVAKFLAEVLGADNFDRTIVIDRAHRINSRVPRKDGRPRVLIARLHYYTDKEKIMSLSRAKGRLFYDGCPVYIFADVSPEVGRQRAAFTQVKNRLRDAGLQYNMVFPAKLIVTVDGTRHTFTDPQAVERFLRTNALPASEEG